MPSPISPDAEELTIKTGGKILAGWTRVRVTAGVEMLPRHFDIELTERYPGQAGQAVVEPGQPCTIDLSGDLVLTGYIDRYMPMYDKHQHRVRLIGRSKTEDVVDCSPDIDETTYYVTEKTIGSAARTLCKPYGIEVSLPDGDADLPSNAQYVSVGPGYTIFFVLEELARSVGLNVWDDERGRLVLSRGGTGGRAGSALVEGVNVERAEVVFGVDQRFARYKVLAQAPDPLFSHANYVADRPDPEPRLLRNRLRIIPQELPDRDQLFSGQRALFEANRRWGRSRVARVTVVGWRDGQGALWQPNTVCSVQLPTAKVNEDRVITEVVFLRGEDGTQTILTLMPKQALLPQPFAITAPVFF